MVLTQRNAIAAFYHFELATLSDLGMPVQIIKTDTGHALRIELGAGRTARLVSPYLEPGTSDDPDDFEITITGPGARVGARGQFGQHCDTLRALRASDPQHA